MRRQNSVRRDPLAKRILNGAMYLLFDAIFNPYLGLKIVSGILGADLLLTIVLWRALDVSDVPWWGGYIVLCASHLLVGLALLLFAVHCLGSYSNFIFGGQSPRSSWIFSGCIIGMLLLASISLLVIYISILTVGAPDWLMKLL
ncbi:MAG TPA: hypothetical protein VGP72_13475 [Planctomycetota bacterium]|jgi:hypothetical protein